MSTTSTILLNLRVEKLEWATSSLCIVYIRKYQVTELTNQKNNSIASYVDMSKEWVNGKIK